MRCLAAYIYMREKVLLCCAALIVEADDPVRLRRLVGDHKSDTGKQLARMPFNVGDNTARLVP